MISRNRFPMSCGVAIDKLAYLINENAEVITSPHPEM